MLYYIILLKGDNDMFERIISILANILSIFNVHINIKKVSAKLKNKKIRNLCLITFFIGIICFFTIQGYIARQASIAVTQVVLNNNTLKMNVANTQALIATVLYSDNSIDNNVLWSSSNEAVATVDSNGIVTALSEGTTTIIAQASRNNTVQISECIITVKSPPRGYSISSRPSTIKSYYYIYVRPYDEDVTQIKLYAKSPSGEIFNPPIDENDLYHFYSECGTWTIYASLENEGGIYEANKPEDFLSLEITDISPSSHGDIIQSIMP